MTESYSIAAIISFVPQRVMKHGNGMTSRASGSKFVALNETDRDDTSSETAGHVEHLKDEESNR